MDHRDRREQRAGGAKGPSNGQGKGPGGRFADGDRRQSERRGGAGFKPGAARRGAWAGDKPAGGARKGEKFEGGARTGKRSAGGARTDRKPGSGARTGAKPAGGAQRSAQNPTARDVALRALRDVARDNAYAAQALDRELSAARLSEEDRRLAAGLFYFTLENRLRIEHCLLARMKERPEPEIMDILSLAAAQILFMDRVPDHAAVDEAVKQTRAARRERQTALVNAVLRGLIRARDAGELTLPDREAEPERYISEKYSVRLELVERLVRAYGAQEAEQIVAWSPDRHSDTIRPNLLRMRGGEFEAWLDANGFAWSRGLVDGAYRVRGAGRLAAHEGYRGGLFSIQGESSMLAALALCVKPGMQVLDACAAPGGKSCLIAETMRGAGRVYAWDLHEHRVELIRAAARRLGLENIRPQVRDAAKRNESVEGAMDAVLVDAPCSGLGVMGDKPDIKYRLSVETIEALVPIQRAILETCAAYVRPGGLLVYSTCTILPEENREQIAAFLGAHPEFEPAADASWLPERLRDRYADGMLQVLPNRDDMDGFFIARLRRKAENYGG